ncbi:hypothetical protein OsJ_19723 [Oryza sativa Japonica Group]|uniref:Trichome birefringence-like N-terminal domain-containing protein n=2 Tax=Oryza TaxID=4527 RepID=B9FIS0_ORYSJ|nr:hypothetical protein OsJ_19723 [Oryza sativa Japonica Group]
MATRKRLAGAALGCLSLFLLSRALLFSQDDPEPVKRPDEASSISLPPDRIAIIAAAPAPSPATAAASDGSPAPAQDEVRCDLFDGSWVYDPAGYPLYDAGECPFLSDQVTCRRNGRPDSGYEHWRWQPRRCAAALRLRGGEMLEQCRDKRVVLVGDSLNRNMWESLACILYAAAPDRSRATVDDASADHKIFQALDYNCTVEFYWSPFLVDLDDQTRVLKLDRLPATTYRRLAAADVLVFNTGHWWTHTGKFRAWDHLERNGKKVEMGAEEAFNRALRTWTRWLDRNVDSHKTMVFFRSISPEHKNKNWCYNETAPMARAEEYVEAFPRGMVSIVERNVRRARTAVGYLDITRLSELRRDAHPSVFTPSTRKRDVKKLVQEHSPCQPSTLQADAYTTGLSMKEIERRRKIGAANKGKVPWTKGRKLSKEHKELIKRRTTEALRDPKVRKKMLGHRQLHRQASKDKIGAALRKIWERRMVAVKARQEVLRIWSNSIAEAAKYGDYCQDKLDWDSYDRIKSEMISMFLWNKERERIMKKLEKAEAKIVAKKLQAAERSKLQTRGIKKLQHQKLVLRKSDAQPTRVVVSTRPKLKERLTKWHDRKKELETMISSRTRKGVGLRRSTPRRKAAERRAEVDLVEELRITCKDRLPREIHHQGETQP